MNIKSCMWIGGYIRNSNQMVNEACFVEEFGAFFPTLASMQANYFCTVDNFMLVESHSWGELQCVILKQGNIQRSNWSFAKKKD